MSILILDDDGVRRQIIEGIASGLTMAEVSVKVGVDTTTIHSYRCADQEFDRVVVDASFAVGGNCFPVYRETPPYKNRLLQARIVDDVLKGGGCLESDLVRVAEKHGYRLRQVLMWRAYDDQWAAAFEGALIAVRDPGVEHGSWRVAKKLKCRCVDCRSLTYPWAVRPDYLLRGKPYRDYGAERPAPMRSTP
ncbi:hypothetical protein OG884_00590 [Streptosporangium sp. NBC_01755]|uniref:hypothetical protein n=1 Tax=unclassified Streptosporangium TaxID=2632669 RepID=UPI002DDBA0CC|nr:MULTISPECIES: hypothetical protein [unclassified Streptosporangium]WSA28051.1 hypothetical protein OIE13_09375 [Streptosporangium sp. NBC_01810]WSD00476.1 hypothetical protein OG884_00590 [Streptosporangium sp. NBC_01755]